MAVRLLPGRRVSNFEWWMTGILSGTATGGGMTVVAFGDPLVTGIMLTLVGLLGFASMYVSMTNRRG